MDEDDPPSPAAAVAAAGRALAQARSCPLGDAFELPGTSPSERAPSTIVDQIVASAGVQGMAPVSTSRSISRRPPADVSPIIERRAWMPIRGGDAAAAAAAATEAGAGRRRGAAPAAPRVRRLRGTESQAVVVQRFERRGLGCRLDGRGGRAPAERGHGESRARARATRPSLKRAAARDPRRESTSRDGRSSRFGMAARSEAPQGRT